MPVFAIYALKLSVSLAVVYLFYRLVLCRLTFYTYNRWYLLGYTVLSFFIPFIDVSSLLQQNQWADKTLIQWVPIIGNASAVENTSAFSSNFFSAWNILAFIAIAGMFVMLVRLLMQLISFKKMIKKAKVI